MSQANYYILLGVPRNASLKEIRRAYHRLAREWHPDLNRSAPDAADRMRELNEAYEALRKEASRDRYDRLLELFSTPWHSSAARSAGRGRIVMRRKSGLIPLLITLALTFVVAIAGLQLVSGLPARWANRAVLLIEPESPAAERAIPQNDPQSAVIYPTPVDGAVGNGDGQPPTE